VKAEKFYEMQVLKSDALLAKVKEKQSRYRPGVTQRVPGI
jgi:hypothetical protein